MGLLDRIKRRSKNVSTVSKTTKPDTVFVTHSEEDDFEKSMYGQLQLMSADAELIEAVLHDRGYRVRKQIELITKLLEISNDETDEKVKTAFQELKRDYEEARRLADGEYTINELLANNRRMDKTYETYLLPEDLKKAIDEYISYIQKIQDKIVSNEHRETPLLNDVQRQRFNQISLNSEYRIKMLELMYLLKRSNVEENPFKNLSTLKQRMFSKFFIEDIKRAIAQFGRIMQDEELYKEKANVRICSIENDAKRINDLLADAQMIDDFSIRQIFDSKNSSAQSFDFLKSFIMFKMKMISLEDDRDKYLKEKSEDEKKREESEKERKAIEERIKKLVDASDREIADEIYRLEHDITAKGSRFVNILDYQKKVAKARGLLDTDNMTQDDGIVSQVFNSVDILEVIENANKSGVNYLVFPDCQERSNGGFLVIVSKTDRDILELSRKQYKFYQQGSGDWKDDYSFGKLPPYVLTKLYGIIVNVAELGSDAIENNLSLRNGEFRLGHFTYRSSNITRKTLRYKALIEEYIEDIARKISDRGETPEELKDVLCYLSVAATTNIIPILQKFKSAGVDVYMEPVPCNDDNNGASRNQNNRDNIHIYFERRNLDKVKNEVLKESQLPIFEHSHIGTEAYRQIMEESRSKNR